MTSEVLCVDRQGPLLVATVNRPSRGNAINQPVLDALNELAAIVETGQPAGRVRALVITGTGAKAFSTGADISELAGLDHARAYEQMRRGQRTFDRIESLPVAVIAAINGLALGGGLELAMAADLRIAAPSARLGQPEITLANLPGWGGTQRLPRLIGPGHAKELILTGEQVSAERACQIGLVTRVVPDPLDAAVVLAERLASFSPQAVLGAKQAIAVGLDRGFAAGLEAEADAVAVCCETEAQHAAVDAFLARSAR